MLYSLTKSEIISELMSAQGYKTFLLLNQIPVCLNPFADVEKTLYLDFRKFYLEFVKYISIIFYVFYITNGNISKKRNLSEQMILGLEV